MMAIMLTHECVNSGQSQGPWVSTMTSSNFANRKRQFGVTWGCRICWHGLHSNAKMSKYIYNKKKGNEKMYRQIFHQNMLLIFVPNSMISIIGILNLCCKGKNIHTFQHCLFCTIVFTTMIPARMKSKMLMFGAYRLNHSSHLNKILKEQ